MNFLKTSLLFALCFIMQTSMVAQEWTSYQSQQQVNDVVETDTELLLATDAGLVVVNKVTLEKTFFNKANSNLSNNHIQTITKSADGKSFIGTYDAIMGFFDGSGFQDFTQLEHPAFNQNTELYDLKIAPNGDYWLATNDGVFQRVGSQWSHYANDVFGDSFFEAWDLAINDEGDIFMASADIHQFKNGVWTNLSEGTELSPYLDADLFLSSSGDLFVSGDLGSIGRFDGEQWQQYDIDFNGSEVVGFTEDQNGNIFFNSRRDGVYKLENEAWVQQANAQTAAVNNVTPFFYIDQENNQWVNSDIHLSVNKNGTIENTLISQHTLETNNIRNVNQGENGKIYFITGSVNNFSVVDAAGEWSFLPKPPSAAPFEFFRDILALADNDIWVLSFDALYHYNGSEWTRNEELAGYAMDIDSQGKIYIQTNSKIIVMDGGVLSEYTSDNSMLSSLPITALGIDSEDNLWIGTADFYEDNVIQKRSTDGTWTTYSAADHPVIDRLIGDIHFDVNGNVWVPNDHVGAIKFDGTTFTNPFEGNIGQMANYSVSDIESDASGKVYFSHQYGLTSLMNDEFGDILIDEVPAIAISSGATAILFDEEGTLWWGSQRYGVFTYAAPTTSTSFPGQKTNSDFTLYPNPAIDFATLSFSTLQKATIAVYIYNNLGQLISTSALGELPAGQYQESLNVAQLPSGIYTLRLQINDQSAAKFIVIE